MLARRQPSTYSHVRLGLPMGIGPRPARNWALRGGGKLTHYTLVGIGHLPPAASARGPGQRAYLSASGMYFKSVGPVYSDRGRINRLLPCCSSTWAAQPETRLKAKIGVN